GWHIPRWLRQVGSPEWGSLPRGTDRSHNRKPGSPARFAPQVRPLESREAAGSLLPLLPGALTLALVSLADSPDTFLASPEVSLEPGDRGGSSQTALPSLANALPGPGPSADSSEHTGGTQDLFNGATWEATWFAPPNSSPDLSSGLAPPLRNP